MRELRSMSWTFGGPAAVLVVVALTGALALPGMLSAQEQEAPAPVLLLAVAQEE